MSADEDDDAEATAAPQGLFRWGAVSDVGRVREINQDSMYARDGLFVVADGMGGHRGGEVASAVAVDVMQRVVDEPAIDTLVEAVRDANQAVFDKAATDAALMGMGTTLCAMAQVASGDDTDGDDPQLGIVNVGDSRVYLHSRDGLVQVTDDHSLVAEMVRDGQLSADEAAVHPQRNVVTRALGIQADVLIDYWQIPARNGDRFVLSSDGLFDEVTESQMSAVLRRLEEPEEAARELVRLANESGARDNVTVVVVDIVDGPEGGPVALPAAPAVGAPIASAGASPAVDDEPAEAVEVPDRSAASWLKRTAAIVLAVLLLLAVVFGFVARYARDNYFVTFETDAPSEVDNSQVVIFQGRPNGVLWFDPTVEERTPILGLDLTDALILEVEQVPEFDTFDAARRYVVDLTTRATDATG